MTGQLTLIPGGALEATDEHAAPDGTVAPGKDDPTATTSDKENTR